MADDRMAALELLRKAAGDGDLDFLKEGVAVLAQLVMDAEVRSPNTPWLSQCRQRTSR